MDPCEQATLAASRATYYGAGRRITNTLRRLEFWHGRPTGTFSVPDFCDSSHNNNFFDFSMQAFSGNIPYHHLHNSALVTLSIVQGVLPQRPDSIDDDLWRVLENCWQYDPHNRPSMNVISPWIRLVREQQRLRIR